MRITQRYNLLFTVSFYRLYVSLNLVFKVFKFSSLKISGAKLKKLNLKPFGLLGVLIKFYLQKNFQRPTQKFFVKQK
jgi:hypothetical protein